MKRLIAAIIGAAFLLGACNTMEGFGRDVEKGGDKIEQVGRTPQVMDVREQLRHDHAKALAELDGVARETDARRGLARLARLRRAWMVHSLAEESVVYRVLEGVPPTTRADERFVEHELVEGLFDKLTRVRFGTLEWQARIRVVRELITRHTESEEGGLFINLSERFSAEELVELGHNFVLARDKLTLLEEAKKAA